MPLKSKIQSTSNFWITFLVKIDDCNLLMSFDTLVTYKLKRTVTMSVVFRFCLCHILHACSFTELSSIVGGNNHSSLVMQRYSPRQLHRKLDYRRVNVA